MMGWYGGGWGPGMWVGMGVGMLLFWGLVTLLVMALWRGFGARRPRPTEPQPSSGSGDRALRVLDERFANGDITEEEYRHRRDVLQDRR